MTVEVFAQVFTPQQIDLLRAYYHDLAITSVRYHDDGRIFRVMKHSQI